MIAWETATATLLDDMVRCGYCGVVSLGGKPNHWKTVSPDVEIEGTTAAVPPSFAANTLVPEGLVSSIGKWYKCCQCARCPKWSKQHFVFLEEPYVKGLFECTPEDRQTLSPVELDVDLERKMSGMLGLTSPAR